jgi:hypothetical protein
MTIVVAFDGRVLAASDAKAIAEAIKSLFMVSSDDICFSKTPLLDVGSS